MSLNIYLVIKCMCRPSQYRASWAAYDIIKNEYKILNIADLTIKFERFKAGAYVHTGCSSGTLTDD